MGGIVLDEGGKQPVDFRFRRVAPVRRQAALDHAAGAAADHRPRGFKRDGGQAFARQDDVERVDQVGRGIDQRAVEIEDDGGHGAWHG